MALRGSDGASRYPLIAGGTDLLPLMHADLLSPRRLVDLKAGSELRYLRFGEDGMLHIGALATLGELERCGEVADHLPILLQSVREAATPQLRAAATVAGNLLQRPRCWYFRGSHTCWLKGGDRCYAVGGDNRYHAILGGGPCVGSPPVGSGAGADSPGCRADHRGAIRPAPDSLSRSSSSSRKETLVSSTIFCLKT